MNLLWLPSAITMALISPLADKADEEAIAPSLADPATEVLNLDEDRYNRLTIPVRVDGAGPFDFMIDTGSQATAITDKVHDKLALEPSGTAIIVGTASRKRVDMVEVEKLEIGRRTFHDFSAPVLQSMHVGADGILGLDNLQGLRVLIDFRNETIAVADIDEKPSNRGYEIIVRAKRRLGQLLITNADIDGVRATVIIDTGAQASLGNLALRERIRQRRAEEVTTMDVNGVTLIGQLSVAREVTIQDMTFTNIPITYADTPAFEALGLKDQPVLSLGMQSLRLFDRVAIDFSRQRVLFDLPGRTRGKYRANHASRLES